jgi:hypothetical protein
MGHNGLHAGGMYVLEGGIVNSIILHIIIINRENVTVVVVSYPLLILIPTVRVEGGSVNRCFKTPVIIANTAVLIQYHRIIGVGGLKFIGIIQHPHPPGTYHTRKAK